MYVLLSLFLINTFFCHTSDREIPMTQLAKPIALFSQEQFVAAMKQLPEEIRNHIFSYINFFHTQYHKVYHKTINPQELVGTIQLACACRKYDFLAAIEMRRFFHKPELIGNLSENTGLLIDFFPQKYTIARNKLMKIIQGAPLSYKPDYPLTLSSTLAFAPALRYNDDQKTKLRLAYDNQTQQPTLIMHTEKSTAVVSLSAVGAPTIYGHPIAAAYKTMQCGSWAWPLFITTEDDKTVILTFDETTRSICIVPEISPEELLAESQTRSSQLVYNQRWRDYEVPHDIHPDHYVLVLPENGFSSRHNNNRIGSMWDVQQDIIYTVIDHSQRGIDIKIHDLKPYRATSGFHRLLLASIMGFCNIDYTSESEKRESAKNILITATPKMRYNALAKHLIKDIEKINTHKANCMQNKQLAKVIDLVRSLETKTEDKGKISHMPITVTWVNEPNE